LPPKIHHFIDDLGRSSAGLSHYFTSLKWKKSLMPTRETIPVGSGPMPNDLPFGFSDENGPGS